MQEAGQEPHLLMMSATPIPRTLAMSYYADLDVSTIDELPPGRTPVVTKLIADSRRDEVTERIRAQVAQGRQVYWVCPLIEESEALDLTNATATHEALSAALPGVMVGLLHSRMPPAEKKAVMSLFTGGQMGVLVSTTVIEVGVDVPNASLMVIEHAERFGLSQLHQLRGRVGRGAAASACVLLYSAGEAGRLGETARARLKAMVETADGFEIARRDLEIRGPGEFLGARQSGAPLLRFADLATDAQLLEWARQLAPHDAGPPSGIGREAHCALVGWKIGIPQGLKPRGLRHDPHELKYIVAVAREKHFGKAAEACFVSQPTLSVAIKKLEDELEVKLFERSANEVTVTPLGEDIVRQAQSVLEQAASIKEIAKRGKDPLAGPLKLGVIYTIGPYLLPDLVRQAIVAHAADAADAAGELHREAAGDAAHRRDRLRDHGRALSRTPGWPWRQLYDEPFLAAVPSTHPLARQDHDHLAGAEKRNHAAAGHRPLLSRSRAGGLPRVRALLQRRRRHPQELRRLLAGDDQAHGGRRHGRHAGAAPVGAQGGAGSQAQAPQGRPRLRQIHSLRRRPAHAPRGAGMAPQLHPL